MRDWEPVGPRARLERKGRSGAAPLQTMRGGEMPADLKSLRSVVVAVRSWGTHGTVDGLGPKVLVRGRPAHDQGYVGVGDFGSAVGAAADADLQHGWAQLFKGSSVSVAGNEVGRSGDDQLRGIRGAKGRATGQVGRIRRNGSIRHEDVVRMRSEERRVGKECRSRWWAYH